jgi:hypothetical protein
VQTASRAAPRTWEQSQRGSSKRKKSKLAQYAYEDDHSVGWDEARIFLKEMQGLDPYGMFNQSDRPTQFEDFFHMDPPYQQ